MIFVVIYAKSLICQCGSLKTENTKQFNLRHKRNSCCSLRRSFVITWLHGVSRRCWPWGQLNFQKCWCIHVLLSCFMHISRVPESLWSLRIFDSRNLTAEYIQRTSQQSFNSATIRQWQTASKQVRVNRLLHHHANRLMHHLFGCSN